MTTVTHVRATSSQPAAPLLVRDLLTTADELAPALLQTLAASDWLDAFLLSAGLSQLVEDALHPDPLLLNRAASYLRGRRSTGVRLAAAATGAAAAALGSARTTTATQRQLVAARHGLADLTGRLATLVLDAQRGERGQQGLLELAERLSRQAVALLGPDVVRLPACFRSFDQHPDDVRWLVRAYLERCATPPRAVCVVGVRTSGSYLAPLHAASLAASGVRTVSVLTYRPGRPLLRWEKAALRVVVQAGGSVVVTDDPPGSGTSLAATLEALIDAGVPRERITLALSLFSDDLALPQVLAPWRAVLQPWSQWSVHQRLGAPSVGSAMTRMLGDGWALDTPEVCGEPSSRGARGHGRARFAFRLTDRGTDLVERRDVVVEGAGLGYLGRHAVAVADVLSEHVPRVYGFADGLLYRDWLPAAERSSGRPWPAVEDVAAYVAARSRALAVRGDPTGKMRGRDPVWEVAAALLSRAYGPLAPLARPWLLEPVARRLLAVDRASVVDGTTDGARWIPPRSSHQRVCKVDFHQRAFGHLELACYDPVFDLAGAAVDPPDHVFEARLRAAYHAETGQEVDGERWLLYRLTQLWRHAKAGDLETGHVAELSAAAVHDYLAGCYLVDCAPGRGPVCAIDLDGVLETDRLGYPASSPKGVLAVRALLRHGFRPVLATGRSLGEAQDRCATFGLAGAVAEYGTVTYDHGSGAVTDLRSSAERRLIEAVRRELIARGLTVDGRHRHAVRASVDGGPVPADVLRSVPLLADPLLQVITGEGQTDITLRRIDKSTGLDDLTGRLGVSRCAFAVGDSVWDLPMLTQAVAAGAPRNADAEVRAAGVAIARHSYQAGLADACAAVLGHRPGGCPVCRPPSFSPRTRTMLAILRLREGGLTGLPRQSLALAGLAAGGAPW